MRLRIRGAFRLKYIRDRFAFILTDFAPAYPAKEGQLDHPQFGIQKALDQPLDGIESDQGFMDRAKAVKIDIAAFQQLLLQRVEGEVKNAFAPKALMRCETCTIEFKLKLSLTANYAVLKSDMCSKHTI